jgi:putative FmdB family regulatory protein
MPIYEFKCLKCEEYIEILVMGSNDDQVEMKCNKCGCEDLERILSAASHSIVNGQGAPQASAQTRTCSSGSCTTWDLPGHSR